MWCDRQTSPEHIASSVVAVATAPLPSSVVANLTRTYNRRNLDNPASPTPENPDNPASPTPLNPGDPDSPTPVPPRPSTSSPSSKTPAKQWNVLFQKEQVRQLLGIVRGGATKITVGILVASLAYVFSSWPPVRA